MDFKNRADLASTFMKQDDPMKGVFSQIEKTILPQAYLSSLVYDKDKVTVICMVDSYDTEAKQILAFKNNPDISSFVLNKSYTDSNTGALSFNASFKVK